MRNRDWIVEVQFDGSKVHSGFRKIDNMYQKTARTAISLEREKRREMKKTLTDNSQLLKTNMALTKQRFKQAADAEAKSRAELRSRLALHRKITREQLAQANFEKVKAKRVEAINARMDSIRHITSRGGFKKGDEIKAKEQLEALSLQKQALEATKTKLAYERLDKATVRLIADSRRLEAQGRRVAASFNAKKFAADRAVSSIKHLAASYLSVFGAIQGAGAFYRTGKEFQSFQASLLAASGDAKTAEQNMAFLEKTSMKLGVSLTAGVAGFNKLGVAARSQGYDMQQVRDIYTSIAEASTAFGLNAAKQNLVFLATSQMISKAKVSAEELRRQLGDNMPIAIEAMRRAYSDFKGEVVDMPEFTKAMESGKIMSKDVMGAFAKHMSEMAREGGALNAAMTKLMAEQMRATAALQLNIKDVFDDEDTLGLFTSGWKDVVLILQESKPLFHALGNVMGVLFKTVTTLGKAALPVFKLLGVVINNLAYPFKVFSDTIKSIKASEKPLNSFEKTLLRIHLALQYLQLGFYKTLKAFNDMSGALAVGEGDSGLVKMAKGTASWALAIAGLSVAFKVLGKVLSFILSPLKLVGKLLGLGGVAGSAATGAKVGSKLASVLSMSVTSAFKNLGATAGRLFMKTFATAVLGAGAEAWYSILTGQRAWVSKMFEGVLGKDAYIKFSDTLGKGVDAFATPFSQTARDNLTAGRNMSSSSLLGAGRISPMGGTTVYASPQVNIKIDNAKEDVKPKITEAMREAILFGS